MPQFFFQDCNYLVLTIFLNRTEEVLAPPKDIVKSTRLGNMQDHRDGGNESPHRTQSEVWIIILVEMPPSARESEGIGIRLPVKGESVENGPYPGLDNEPWDVVWVDR